MNNESHFPEFASGVAIIGMAGRFPGAPDIESFWRMLVEAREGLRRFTLDELRALGVPESQLRDPDFVPVRGVLEDADRFEAELFGYSPREAAMLDPQQRLFLETAWAAMEAAGYDPQRYKGSVGVYGSSGLPGYLLQNLSAGEDLLQADDGYQIMISNDKDFLATRVSYKLGLRGPSLTVQTGCSSSLVAVTQACLGLLGNQCDIALAGGVSLGVPLVGGYLYREGGIFAPDGYCRPFDAAARGTVLGSGVGLVVLKRFEDAWRDGDHIHAVIRGFGVNNDGAEKAGYTAPSVEGQAEALSIARAMAGVAAESIGYVEAHGTATPLGDPVEVEALTLSFREETRRSRFCVLGSVKSNVGHLDVAAGVTGLIKVALCVERGIIPGTLHFQSPNPQIDFAESPFVVQARTLPWPADGRARIAGVSSFGIGGTNAHVIVQAPPPREPSIHSRRWHLLPVSGHTADTRSRLTERLVAHLNEKTVLSLADVAHTLQQGRRQQAWRDALVVEDVPGRGPVLSATSTERTAPEVAPGVAFLFTGQGSQYANMGSGLYESEPVFRAAFDQCAEILRWLMDLDLRTVVLPGEAVDALKESMLTRTAIAQPALFAVEYALARLWQSVGVEPRVLMGHSLGEYTAACLAGTFDLESALALVVRRGRLMQSVPPGAMMAVALSEAVLCPRLPPGVELAAINTPTRCVVTGTIDALSLFHTALSAEDVPCRMLATSHAMHSRMMEPILNEFCEAVRCAAPKPPTRPVISGLTGRLITPAEATDPRYWARQLREPVRFAQGLESCATAGAAVLVEVGPGNTLATFATETFRGRQGTEVASSMRHPRQSTTDPETWLRAVGRLWTAGVPIDFAALHGGAPQRRIPLPTYPFAGARYWLEREGRGDGQGSLRMRTDPGEVAILPTTPDARLPATTPLGVPDGRLQRERQPGRWRHTLPSAQHEPPTPVEHSLQEHSQDWQSSRSLDFSSSEEGIETHEDDAGYIDPLLTTVCEILREALGVGRMAPADDFFVLGGHSLLAIRVIGRIRQELQVSLAAHDILECPTPRQLAARVRERLPEKVPGVDVNVVAADHLPLMTRLQGGERGQPPLVLIHPIGGTVFQYRELVKHLPPRIPVYAVRPLGTEEGETIDSSIEEMAARYLEATRQMTGTVRCVYGGHSFGGVVAWEMAQRVQREFGLSPLVLMFDTPGPQEAPHELAEEENVRNYIQELAPEFFSSLERFNADVDGSMLGHLEAEGFAGIHRFFELYRVLGRVMRAYEARPYTGPVAYFLARDRDRFIVERPEKTWLQLVTDGLRLCEVSGNHFSMVLGPHVRELGRRVARIWEDVDRMTK